MPNGSPATSIGVCVTSPSNSLALSTMPLPVYKVASPGRSRCLRAVCSRDRREEYLGRYAPVPRACRDLRRRF
jgi:hypothetical protein